MSPTISIIAAVDEKRGIGKNNALPWYIPEDLKRFKKLTMDHPVIMGRKTYESILVYLGKPLPGRTNIVITRSPGTSSVHRSGNVGEAIAYAKRQAIKQNAGEIFIIGGAQIFQQTINLADKLYLTLIQANFDCDFFFPEYSQFTRETFRERHLESTPPFTWLNLEKPGV